MVIGSVLFLCFTWLAGWAAFYKVPFLFNQSKDLTEYPSLSIIIPARNEAENLPILLKTLQQQKFSPKEIIVSDDNSTDSTIEV
ncbi:MAG: glycosyltransferase, partial [Desemzia incerta]